MMYRFTSVLLVLLWVQQAWADEDMPAGEIPKASKTHAAGDGSKKLVDPIVEAQTDNGDTEPSLDLENRAASGSNTSLTPADKAILDKGLYSNGEIYGTALIGFTIGFGAGHLVQGRYFEKGWIATGGTLAGLLIMKGATDSSFLFGLAICVGTRVWEVRDLVNSSKTHNRRYRALRQQNSVGLLPMTDGERHGLVYTMTF